MHNNYPWGWTMAGNTPLRRWKRETHEGGVADPCIVHWPRGIAVRGERRRQFVHAIDVLPTILDAIGITPPAQIGGVEQQPIEGASFVATLTDASAPTRDTQYFEMLGSRAIYHDGWKAVTWKPLGKMYSLDDDPDLPFDDDVWELFHVAEDFSESHDLAAEQPEKLRELQDLWWREAERYQVLPLDNRPQVAIFDPAPRPWPARSRYEYRPGGTVPEAVAVDVKRRSHTITAEVELPAGVADGEADGVLLAMGATFGGFSLYVQDGRLQYVHNLVARSEEHIGADEVLTPARTPSRSPTAATSRGAAATGRSWSTTGSSRRVTSVGSHP